MFLKLPPVAERVGRTTLPETPVLSAATRQLHVHHPVEERVPTGEPRQGNLPDNDRHNRTPENLLTPCSSSLNFVSSLPDSAALKVFGHNSDRQKSDAKTWLCFSLIFAYFSDWCCN